MEREHSDSGSELHRLKPMKDYDQEVFDRLYKICKPVIRNLVRQIDIKRFNLTVDIIRDQFWDKFLFVFNKYYGTCEEEHLKARILSSLSTYKNKILRCAYSPQAEYNLELKKLDDLYDDSKELEDDTDEQTARSQMLEMMYAYMRKHLSRDAYILFEVLVTPPPYIQARLTRERISNQLLLEFFGLEHKRSSLKYLADLREEIDYWKERAKKDLHY